jgi:hypothetical protein
LTPEEITSLKAKPEASVPVHHQVDPRIIKAYLARESIPTFLPRQEFGIRQLKELRNKEDYVY